METLDILILTASFGNGHNAATQALVEKIHSLFPDMKVTTRDLFDLTTPKLKHYLEDTYKVLTRSGIPFYNALYHLRNQKENLIDDMMLKLYYGRFETVLDTLKPKMIISVFPTCAQFANHYKVKRDAKVKTITVMTDVVSGWEWLHDHTDMYCVPALDVKKVLIEKGVLAERIFVTGVPVGGRFKARYGQKSSLATKRVLMMGSAMGKLSFTQKTLETMGEMPYLFTVVAGEDSDLYERLMGMDLPENILVHGYMTNISELMKESDLIITKPGGVTIFEAIESNLPMLLQPSEAGQENKNRDFVQRYGFGETYKSGSDMLRKIDGLLTVDIYTDAIKQNMHEFRVLNEQDLAFSTMRLWAPEAIEVPTAPKLAMAPNQMRRS